MGGGDAIILIIFVIIFVISGLKRLLQMLAEQAEGERAQRPDVEATPTEIEEFLRGLQAARRQQPQARARQVAAPRAGRIAARAPAEAPPAAPFWQEGGPGAREPVPQVRPTRVQRRPEPKEPAPGPTPARERAEAAPAAAATPVAVTPAGLKRISLKDAIVWSEILGPPLSMRRGGGRRPNSRA